MRVCCSRVWFILIMLRNNNASGSYTRPVVRASRSVYGGRRRRHRRRGFRGDCAVKGLALEPIHIRPDSVRMRTRSCLGACEGGWFGCGESRSAHEMLINLEWMNWHYLNSISWSWNSYKNQQHVEGGWELWVPYHLYLTYILVHDAPEKILIMLSTIPCLKCEHGNSWNIVFNTNRLLEEQILGCHNEYLWRKYRQLYALNIFINYRIVAK